MCVCIHKHVHRQILSRQDLSSHGTFISCEENSEGLVLWFVCPNEPVDRAIGRALGPCSGTGATLGACWQCCSTFLLGA